MRHNALLLAGGLAALATADAFQTLPLGAARLSAGSIPAAVNRRASSQAAWTAKSSLSPLSRVPALLKSSADRASTALSASSASAAGDQPKTNIVLLGLYFFAWYALNVGYNITNKQVLNAFPLYGTVAFVQLLCAWVYLIPQWMAGIRPVPSPSKSGLASLQKISLLHGFGHLVTVMSMGLGAVSFVHVVKAAEPVFAAILSAIFAGSVMAFPVYASLLPVCAGVAIASAGELSFSYACFGTAMMSNLLFAARAVFSKMAMSSEDQGKNMDAANTFAVVTMLATLVCFPVVAVLEGPKILPAWAAATAAKGMTAQKLASTLFMSGIYLYTYNEFAFKVLGMVSPVAQAVGNTVKRVVILVATSLAFATPMTPIGITGSAIAMAGVLVYSLVQQAYAKK